MGGEGAGLSSKGGEETYLGYSDLCRCVEVQHGNEFVTGETRSPRECFADFCFAFGAENMQASRSPNKVTLMLLQGPRMVCG